MAGGVAQADTIGNLEKQQEALRYIVTAQATIDDAYSAWEVYGDTVSLAYEAAYEAQESILKNIKHVIDDAKQFQKEAAQLALTVLTLCVAGPLASIGLKSAVGKAIDKAIADEIQEAGGVDGVVAVKKLESITKKWTRGKEVAQKSVKDITKKSLQKVSEPLVNSLQSPSHEDAFRPVGVKPLRYGYEVQKNIHTRVHGLKHQLAQILTFWDANPTGIDPVAARNFYELILKSDFIKDQPKGFDEETLTRKASLALWLSWAWDRDVGYWMQPEHNDINYIPDADYIKDPNSYEIYYDSSRGQSVYRHKGFWGIAKERVTNPEPQYFDPILSNLLTLGVPFQKVSQYFKGGIDSVGVPRGDQRPHMDMWGFIRWAFSSGGQSAFSAGDVNPLGQKYARAQLKQELQKRWVKKTPLPMPI